MARLGFNPLKPENDEEMKLVLSIGNEYAKKYGKATPELKQQAQQEINTALQQRRSSSSQSRSGRRSVRGGPLVTDEIFGDKFQDEPLETEVIPRNLNATPMLSSGSLSEPYPDIPPFGVKSANQPGTFPLYPSEGRSPRATNLDQPLDQRPEYNPQIERDAAAAKVRHGGDFSFGDMTTFDKVAGGAGALALILGMAGVGRKRGNPLAPISKYGLGYAMGSPDRYYNREKRALGREIAPLQAEANIYDAQNKAYTDLDASQIDWNKLRLGGMELDLEASEQDMRRDGTYAGSGADPTVDKIMAGFLKPALKKMRTGQPLNDAEKEALAYAQRSVKYGGMPIGYWAGKSGGSVNPDDLVTIPTIPSTAQVGQAEKDLGKAKSAAALAVGENLWDTVPEDPANAAVENWAWDKGGYPMAPEDTTLMNDIISRAGSGDLRKMYPVGGTGPDWLYPDTLGSNPDLITAAQGFKDLIPMGTGDWMKQHPKFYGQDSTQVGARRDALNAVGMGVQLPAWATAEGLKTQEEALAHLEALKAQGLPADLYNDMLRELGVNNGR